MTSRGERSEATSGGRGVLPDVWRPGAIPRGNWAHPDRKSLRSGLPKMHIGLHGDEFRVGCQPREATGIPAGIWASKLSLRYLGGPANLV